VVKLLKNKWAKSDEEFVCKPTNRNKLLVNFSRSADWTDWIDRNYEYNRMYFLKLN